MTQSIEKIDMKDPCKQDIIDLKEPFDTAVEDVKVLKIRPGYKELGEIYGLYKQATVGDINTVRPGMFDLAGRGKWDAWEKKRGLSKKEAMVAYIKLVADYKIKFGF